MEERFARDFDSLFNPRSVAIVGASNAPGKWGHTIAANIMGGGYEGRLFMVNPGERKVLGFRSYRCLREIGEPVDLAMVTIPASAVIGVVEDAAAAGIRNMVVVSSNFSEVGGKGVELERRLAEAANEAGVTVVGPNTMGIFSARASLCAIGSPTTPLKGGVGFISQSGNLGVQLLSWGRSRGVGFSRFAGSGNAANTDMHDYLRYLGSDPDTRVIALYMEGLRDGRRFLEAAREVSASKPVVVLKGGRGGQGSRAARSHSGAMAGQLELYEGMFQQAGVVEAGHSEEFIDLVAAFDALPRAAGDRVAIMTMGGGWGVVASDACDREGLEVVELPEPLVRKLDGFLPSFWSRGNPVDLVGNLSRSSHFRAMEELAGSDRVDILIVMGALIGKQLFRDSIIHAAVKPFFSMLRRFAWRLPSFIFSQQRVMLRKALERRGVGDRRPEGSPGINPLEAWLWTDRALVSRMERLAGKTGKPIITVAMDEREMSAAARLQRGGIFSAPTPERAVRAAARIAGYGMFAGSDERPGASGGAGPVPGGAGDAVRPAGGISAEDPHWLSPGDSPA